MPVTTCEHCGSNVNTYDFHIDYTDAMAMIALGNEVRERLERGVPFTEANKLHISGLTNKLTPTQIDRKTQLKYLGLIAKYKVNGKHKDSLWCITTWGYEFLRGGTMYKSVTIRNKEILNRFGQTTLLEALENKSTLTEAGWDLACFDKWESN